MFHIVCDPKQYILMCIFYLSREGCCVVREMASALVNFAFKMNKQSYLPFESSCGATLYGNVNAAVTYFC